VPKNKRQTNTCIESFADLSSVIDGYDESPINIGAFIDAVETAISN